MPKNAANVEREFVVGSVVVREAQAVEHKRAARRVQRAAVRRRVRRVAAHATTACRRLEALLRRRRGRLFATGSCTGGGGGGGERIRTRRTPHADAAQARSGQLEQVAHAAAHLNQQRGAVHPIRCRNVLQHRKYVYFNSFSYINHS